MGWRFSKTSFSERMTLSPHESPNQGMRPAPKRIFHVITFRESGKSVGILTEDAV